LGWRAGRQHIDDFVWWRRGGRKGFEFLSNKNMSDYAVIN